MSFCPSKRAAYGRMHLGMIRLLTSLTLALVMALSSQSMAVARGAAPATGQMVLCVGAGTVMVYTDADGRPTSAPHICPDATLNVLLNLAVPDVVAPVTLTGFNVAHAAGLRFVVPLPRLAPPSRGPPV